MANGILASLLINVMAKSDVSGLNKTTKSLKNMGQQASKTSGLLKAMSTRLFGGFNIDSAINMGMKYLQFEKDLGAMQSRFFAITGDQKKAREEFDYIRKVATDTAQDIKSTADSYSIFYAAAAKSMGSSGAQQVFKDWTEVSRVLHLTPYQFERVTYALREMASKGSIYSQDLRMQIGTHVPNAMGLAQKAVEDLGITGTDWFEKFQKQAKGNQPLINEFIKNFSKYAKMQFATPQALKMALQQPDALSNYIKNMGYNFMIEFSQKGGNEAIIRILESVKDTLLKIDYNKLSDTLGTVAKGISKAMPFIMGSLTAITKILLAMLALNTFKSLKNIFVGASSIFSMFSKQFAPWFMYKLGLHKFTPIVLRKGLIEGLIAGIKNVGIDKVLLRMAGFMGGPILTALLFLPEIVQLCRWIWGKFKGEGKSDLENWRTHLTEAGASESNMLATLKALQEVYNKSGRKMSLQELQTRAGYYVGDKASRDINITDKGQVVVNFNGNFLTYEELQDMIKKGAEQEAKRKEGFWSNLFNKPILKDAKPTWTPDEWG